MGCIQCGMTTDCLLLLLKVNINFVSRYLCSIMHILCFSRRHDGCQSIFSSNEATEQRLHYCRFLTGCPWAVREWTCAFSVSSPPSRGGACLWLWWTAIALFFLRVHQCFLLYRLFLPPTPDATIMLFSVLNAYAEVSTLASSKCCLTLRWDCWRHGLDETITECGGFTGVLWKVGV